jgi:hypothetical protein
MRDVKQTEPDPTNVLNCDSTMQVALADLLKTYGLDIQFVPENTAIPGSFFGEREAGLIENSLYLRFDTPVHSALHEACHYICMSPDRRTHLDTDAEGDFNEENGVCYLQILLAGQLSNMGAHRMMLDMDRWGYSFRLGSARAWFDDDAQDAILWLQRYGILDQTQQITRQYRLID